MYGYASHKDKLQDTRLVNNHNDKLQDVQLVNIHNDMIQDVRDCTVT